MSNLMTNVSGWQGHTPKILLENILKLWENKQKVFEIDLKKIIHKAFITSISKYS
jgi:hypothetical protein